DDHAGWVGDELDRPDVGDSRQDGRLVRGRDGGPVAVPLRARISGARIGGVEDVRDGEAVVGAEGVVAGGEVLAQHRRVDLGLFARPRYRAQPVTDVAGRIDLVGRVVARVDTGRRDRLAGGARGGGDHQGTPGE